MQFRDNCSEGQISKCNIAASVGIQEQLKRFCALQKYSQVKVHSREEQACEDIFENTTRRKRDSKCMITLPMGALFSIVIKRFHNLEKRLASGTNLKEMYWQFMYEYASLGYMNNMDMIV